MVTATLAAKEATTKQHAGKSKIDFLGLQGPEGRESQCMQEDLPNCELVRHKMFVRLCGHTRLHHEV